MGNDGAALFRGSMHIISRIGILICLAQALDIWKGAEVDGAAVVAHVVVHCSGVLFFYDLGPSSDVANVWSWPDLSKQGL